MALEPLLILDVIDIMSHSALQISPVECDGRVFHYWSPGVFIYKYFSDFDFALGKVL